MEVQLNYESESAFNLPHNSYIAVHDGNIYYINTNKNSVLCFNIHKSLKWEFQDTQKLQYPQCISVDNNGNVYVVSVDINSVVVISSDGKHCRQILSASDGLNCPRALHFERKNNKSLVANETKFAFLFDVS